MKNQTRRQGSRPEWIVLIFTISALLILPSRTRLEVIRSFAKPLVIQTSKTSPPRLAFHETLDRQSVFPEPNEAKNIMRIDLNQMLARESSGLHGLKAIRNRKMILSPMQVARETAMHEVDQQAWIEKLPTAQRRRVQFADERSRLLEQDWKIPTWADAAEEKINEIKKQTASAKTSNVYVAAADVNGNWRTPAQVHANVGVEVNRPADPLSTSSPTNRDSGPADHDPSRKGPGSQTANESDRHVVSGLLTVTSEAAVGTGRHLEVRWYDDGIAKEVGSIIQDQKKNWLYSIEIPSLSGSVVVSVHDTAGLEIGSGQYRVSSLDNLERLRNAPITIQPRSRVTRYSQNFYDSDSSQQMMSVSRAHRNPTPEVLVSAFNDAVKSDDDGTVQVDGIGEGSWTFLRTERKGFYPGLHLVSAGNEKAMPLFPEKMMKALIQIVRDTHGSGIGGESGAIVWGQVTKRKGGLAGAKVELEDLPEAEPIYFNDLLIPDQKMQATSQNGYFAFVDLPRGFYSLRVLQGEKQAGIGNVEVDDGTVSPIQIATDALIEKIPVKVFDAFTGSPQIAKVEFQHLQEELEITGYAPVEIPQDDSLSLVRVTPIDSNYVESVEVLSSHQDFFHIPLVRQDWLQGLRSALRISQAPQTGTILGFVPGDEYEVDLPHVSGTSNVTVVYFDPQGMPSIKPVAGGGFIVFNTPPGSHTVTVLPKNSAVLHSRVIPVDPGTFNVLKFDF